MFYLCSMQFFNVRAVLNNRGKHMSGVIIYYIVAETKNLI